MKPFLRPLLLLLLIARSAAEPTAAPPFADGETVAFVGDSITHGGLWHRYIADYYATRFPERSVRFLNCGIAGDTAAGVLGRLDSDVLVHKPDTAVVMLGMNDVGRSFYEEGADADAALVAKRTQSLDAYQRNLTKLVERLKAGGVTRLTLVTPSPFDQTAKLPKQNLPGVNDALARCGLFVTEMAAKNGMGVVDFHGPMTALNQKLQVADPAFTLVGGDRVHPGSPGHLVMAWLFLTNQGAPAFVSRTALDARSRKTDEVRGAKLDGINWKNDGVEFTLTEQSLPWWIDADARPALDWVPLIEDLNRQELVVKGLPAGTYALTIDGTEVGRWPAADWAEGVNLATLAATPQAVQAKAVQTLVEERRSIQGELRSIAYVEYKWFKPGTVDFKDKTATATAMEAFVAKGGATAGYYRNIADSYHKAKPQEARLSQRIGELNALIRETARPKPHRFFLRLSAN